MSALGLLRRRLFGLCLFGVWSALVSSCSRSEPRPSATGSGELETLVLRYQGMSGTVQPAELAESLGFLAPLRLSFEGSTISGPQSVQAVVTGDTEFGGAFNGAVINLVAGKAPIRALIGYYGVDELRQTSFFTLSGSPISSARDLIGKKIAVNTLGAHSEFMIKEYLFRSGLSAQDARQVTLVVVPPVNSEHALRQGHVDVAALYDIFRDRALERGGLRTLFSDYDLFGEFTAGSHVFRNDFIRDNPKTVRHFVAAIARAIEWARQTPREEVIARFTSIIAGRGRNEDASVLKYWKSFGVAGKGGVISDREFQIWLDWMVKDGSLKPDQLSVDDIYDNRFNPFAAEAAASPAAVHGRL
jgi:ABC-type nitrate/sulfonate/bicarbonate transport system substrate-binding protein